MPEGPSSFSCQRCTRIVFGLVLAMGALTRPGEQHLAKDDRVKQSVLGFVLNLVNGFL